MDVFMNEDVIGLASDIFYYVARNLRFDYPIGNPDGLNGLPCLDYSPEGRSESRPHQFGLDHKVLRTPGQMVPNSNFRRSRGVPRKIILISFPSRERIAPYL